MLVNYNFIFNMIIFEFVLIVFQLQSKYYWKKISFLCEYIKEHMKQYRINHWFLLIEGNVELLLVSVIKYKVMRCYFQWMSIEKHSTALISI